jgi:hypothetical protein
MPKTLKLAAATDIHHSPDKMTKVGSAAVSLLKEFAAFSQAVVQLCPHNRKSPLPESVPHQGINTVYRLLM